MISSKESFSWNVAVRNIFSLVVAPEDTFQLIISKKNTCICTLLLDSANPPSRANKSKPPYNNLRNFGETSMVEH